MISIVELDGIASARLADAKTLSAAGRFDGATYLCGYAVEIALKARICRVLDWSAFPNTANEFQAYKSFQTHDLVVLLRLSGQEARIQNHHLELWSRVVLWRPESRYNAVGTARAATATAMIAAAERLLERL